MLIMQIERTDYVVSCFNCFRTEYVETMTFVDEFKNVMKFNSDILLDLVVEDNRLSSVDNTVPVMKMRWFY